MFNQIVGLYPTVVTVLVLNEDSLFGAGGVSSTFVASYSGRPSHNIQFKTRNEPRTIDNQLELGGVGSTDMVEPESSRLSLARSNTIDRTVSTKATE
jgi:hypothetical protein